MRGLKGVKETEDRRSSGKKISLAIAHGLSNVEYVLDKIREAKRTGKKMPYHFIEVMACPGGCVGGGGQTYGVTDAIRAKRAAGLYQDDKDKKVRNSHENPHVKKLYEEFIGKPLCEKSEKLFHTVYKARPAYRRVIFGSCWYNNQRKALFKYYDILEQYSAVEARRSFLNPREI